MGLRGGAKGKLWGEKVCLLQAMVPDTCTGFTTALGLSSFPVFPGQSSFQANLSPVYKSLLRHPGSLLASWLNDYIKVICKQHHTQYTKKLSSIKSSVFISFVPIICLMSATF